MAEKSRTELEAIEKAFGRKPPAADAGSKAGRDSFRVSLTPQQRRRLEEQRQAAVRRAAG